MKSSWDVFICHASEDKSSFVRPLADALIAKGLNVWYDEYTVRVGDSLRQVIENGLMSSRHGIVVLSPAFLRKKWTHLELSTLFSLEKPQEKRVLPIWHNIQAKDVLKISPLLADRVAASTKLGLDNVVSDLIRVIKQEGRYDDHSGYFSSLLEKQEDDISVELSHAFYNLMTADYDLGVTLENKRILVVDDEEVSRNVTKRIFRKLGATMDEAKDGNEALEFLEQKPIDLVISDIVMPNMSGIELVKRIRSNYPSIPTVIFSGYSDGSNIQDNYHLAFLQKPFRPHEIVDVVKQIFDKRLYEFAESLFSDFHNSYRILVQCRRIVHNFLTRFASNNLFETAIRHKIKDTIRQSSILLRQNMVGLILLERFFHKLKWLEELMEKVTHTSEIGLQKILEAIIDDISTEYPKITVRSKFSKSISSKICDDDLETFFAICALELSGNAGDAIESEGLIEIICHYKLSDNSLILSVGNNGPEILCDDLDQIFSEGFSTKGPNRGMGLYILKQLAHKFNASIDIHNDQGTRFVVTAPLKL